MVSSYWQLDFNDWTFLSNENKFNVFPDKKQTISGTITAPLYSVNTGSITSPNFPYGYALNGEAFTYTLQNLDPYGHVRLVFDDWDLAEESYIEV